MVPFLIDHQIKLTDFFWYGDGCQYLAMELHVSGTFTLGARDGTHAPHLQPGNGQNRPVEGNVSIICTEPQNQA